LIARQHHPPSATLLADGGSVDPDHVEKSEQAAVATHEESGMRARTMLP
jgi:hypothetical protein